MLREWVDTIVKQAGILNRSEFTDRFFVLCYTHACRNFKKDYPHQRRSEHNPHFKRQLVDSTHLMLSYLERTLTDW